MLRILLLIGLIQTALGNIIEIKNFKVPELTLINKYNFIFSDLSSTEDLTSAAVKFELKMLP